jgi:isoquinoline 1-oxidoreductase beta subunit
MARLTAGFDAAGLPTALRVRIAGPSFVSALVPNFGANIVDRTFIRGLGDEMPYAVANYHLDYVIRPTPVPLGVWRAINYTPNAFYKESFIDEMAHAVGADPYQFRRLLLADSPRNLAVLDAVAKTADWGGPLPPGVFRGIALNEALTAALYGEITIKGGAAEQENFDSYEMLHLAETPQVETVIVPSGGFWGGVGEPPVPPLAPALCNAIFAATGTRIRSLPLKNHDLRLIKTGDSALKVAR